MNEEYAVYIIECTDGSLYTGITTDVKRRFAEHCAGKGGNYTRAHPPKQVVYTEGKYTRSTALKREMSIKQLSRAQKLQLVRTR